MKNPYLDENGCDTAYYIFHELYLCRIPLVQLRSIDEIRTFGMPSAWDPVVDRQMANEPQLVMKPISEMAELYAQGAQIGIVRPEDTKRIYDRVSNHLEAWKHHIINRLNTNKAPIEDLLLLVKFASAVYEHAKFHMDEEFLESQFGRAFSQRHLNTSSLVSGIVSGAFVNANGGRATAEKSEEEDPHARYPKRQSMAEDFANKLTIRSLNRKPAAVSEDAAAIPDGLSIGSTRSFVDALFDTKEGDA